MNSLRQVRFDRIIALDLIPAIHDRLDQAADFIYQRNVIVKIGLRQSQSAYVVNDLQVDRNLSAALRVQTCLQTLLQDTDSMPNGLPLCNNIAFGHGCFGGSQRLL